MTASRARGEGESGRIADPLDDRALLARAREGDAAAWAALVRRHERLLYAVPRRLGLPPADADEVFQETWITLWRHAHLVRDLGRLPAWLVRTATRASWRLARRRHPDAPLDAAADAASPAPDADRLLEELELRQAIEAALAATREPCRRLLELLFLEPERKSYAEIAALLDVPVGSLGPTRRRCLAGLAAELERRGWA